MAEPSAFEQYLLEKINAARAEHGIAPLASNLELGAAGDSHSDWMLRTGTFAHTGVNGTDPGQREAAAGYDLSGNSTWGENIAYTTTSNPAGLQDEVDSLHASLMNSPGHYANLMNPNFKEVGLGLQEGNYQGRDSAMLTEDFGSNGTGSFVTGVAYSDTNRNGAYDPGEGLGGLTVTATGANGTFTTTTKAAGGYDLGIPTGSYDVTFSGAGATGPNPQRVTVVDHNVKLDLTSAGSSPLETATQSQPQSAAVTMRSAEPITNATASDASAFVPDHATADLARLYHTVLDRDPDASGLAYWTSVSRAGTPLDRLTASLLATPEAQAKTAGLTTPQYVEVLYANALGRHAEMGGLAYWVDRIDNQGASRASVATAIGESSEAHDHLMPFIENGLHLVS